MGKNIRRPEWHQSVFVKRKSVGGVWEKSSFFLTHLLTESHGISVWEHGSFVTQFVDNEGQSFVRFVVSELASGTSVCITNGTSLRCETYPSTAVKKREVMWGSHLWTSTYLVQEPHLEFLHDVLEAQTKALLEKRPHCHGIHSETGSSPECCCCFQLTRLPLNRVRCSPEASAEARGMRAVCREDTQCCFWCVIACSAASKLRTTRPGVLAKLLIPLRLPSEAASGALKLTRPLFSRPSEYWLHYKRGASLT